MSIDIISGNDAVIVNAGSASGKNFSLEMTGGDHVLSIVNTGRARLCLKSLQLDIRSANGAAI